MSSLEELLADPESGTGAVLAFFSTAWCGPGQQQLPVIEEVVARCPRRVELVVVDCDEQPELADRCGIEEVPTVLLYAPAPARAPERATVSVPGARPRAEWVAAIEEVFSR